MNTPLTIRRILVLVTTLLLIYGYVCLFSSCSFPKDATRKNVMPGEVCGKFIKATPMIKGGHRYLFILENRDTLIEKSPVYKNYEKGKWYIVGN